MESSFYQKIKEELQRSTRPIYETLMSSIQEMIADDKLLPGTKFLPDKKMAIELGISHITLAKALNELRQRNVLIRRRAYGTSVPEQKPETCEPHKKVAVIFDDATEKTFQQCLFLQLHQGLESLNCTMLFLSADNDSEKQKNQILKVMRDYSISGCVVWSILSADQAADVLHERPLKYPLIFLDKCYPQFDHDAVTLRNFDCGTAMGRALCQHKIRHAYLISDVKNRKYTSVNNRFSGVQHGGGSGIHWEEIEFSEGRFPEMQWDPEAAAICGDFTAALTFRMFMEKKCLPLPKYCYTFETDIEDHNQIPGFTSYQFECEMGKEAIKILAARLNGKETCSVNHAGKWKVIASKNTASKKKVR